MGVDLLGVFKISAKNLIGLEGNALLNAIGINRESIGPFGFGLSYVDPKTNECIGIRSTEIPLKNIRERINMPSNNPLFVNLWLNHGMEYDEGVKISPNLQLFIEKSKDIYKFTKPEFGFCGYDLGFEPYYWHFSGCVMWLNFFGPELVKKYGQEKLLSAPAYKVEELDDGGVFLQASVGPSMICFPNKEELEKRHFSEEELDLYDEDAQIKKIRKHLGLEEVKNK